MHLTIIGAGAAYPDVAGMSSSSYLLEANGARLLLDLGQGSFANLASRIEPSTLTAVLVSHLHPDHFIDLVALRHYLRYEFDPPRRVRVLGPEGLAARLDALHDEGGFTAQSLDTPAYGEGIREVGPFRIESRLVTHTEESYAVRVCPADASDGPGLVYSGDCGAVADLLPLIRPGDVLLSEVAFGAGPVPPDVFHLDGPAIGRAARSAGARLLLLTHLQLGHDPLGTEEAARREFGGPVQLVRGGEHFVIATGG